MAEIGEIKIEGLQDVEANFKALGLTITKKLLRAALKKGGEPVKAAQERRARRSSAGPSHPDVGHLADHIEIKVTTSMTKGTTAKIGPDKNHWWGGFQEWGTPHSSAEPFIRPAIDENAERSTRIISADLRVGIEREAEKLGKKQARKRP